MMGISDGGLAFVQVKRALSLERSAESPLAKAFSQFVRQALRPAVHNSQPARPWDSYLSDAYHGDIRFCKEVSERLAHDVRQGAQQRDIDLSDFDCVDSLNYC